MKIRKFDRPQKETITFNTRRDRAIAAFLGAPAPDEMVRKFWDKTYKCAEQIKNGEPSELSALEVLDNLFQNP